MTKSEYSHDAGMVFGDTAVERPHETSDGSIVGMAESMMKFGTATAKFTFDQVQNGVWMLTDSRQGPAPRTTFDRQLCARDERAGLRRHEGLLLALQHERNN